MNNLFYKISDFLEPKVISSDCFFVQTAVKKPNIQFAKRKEKSSTSSHLRTCWSAFKQMSTLVLLKMHHVCSVVFLCLCFDGFRALWLLKKCLFSSVLQKKPLMLNCEGLTPLMFSTDAKRNSHSADGNIQTWCYTSAWCEIVSPVPVF